MNSRLAQRCAISLTLLLLLAAPRWSGAMQESALLLRHPAAAPGSLTAVLILDTPGSDAGEVLSLRQDARRLLEAQPAGRVGLVQHDGAGRLMVQAPAPLELARPALLTLVDTVLPAPAAGLEQLLRAAAVLIAAADPCAAVQPLLLGSRRPSAAQAALVPGLQWIPPGALPDEGAARARLLASVPRPDAPQLLAAPLLPLAGEPARHDLAVFLALFEASGREHWPGNLHRFRHSGGRVVDAQGREVLDAVTVRLQPGVIDDWGGVPASGGTGAAGKLPDPSRRRLWSDLAGVDLSAAGNELHPDNPLAVAALAELSPDEARAALAQLRDGAVSGLGDSPHGAPVLLPAVDGSSGLVLLATNAGLLHAIAADSGRERWAFLPARLLSRLGLLLASPPAGERRSHGLDGGLRLVHPVTPDAPRAVLLLAMRRGGDGLYALDLDDPGHPRLLWRLDGATPGFAALGETWSLPVPARIRRGGQVREVVVFGGGHDDTQDQPSPVAASRGNALYVVDLLSGELLASAGSAAGHALVLPAMRYPVPATPRVVDLDQDGLADRAYFGDTGGQLWRVDFGGAGGLADGGLLAELGSTAADGDTATARRFYATPDVVMLSSAGGPPVPQIQLGSGHYPRLLDQQVADAFFAVRDRVSQGQLSDPARRPLQFDELADAGRGDTPDDDAGRGWRLALDQDPGEKVLQPALSLGGRVYFSSFAPATGAACGEPVGRNRLYELALRDGRPALAADPLQPGLPPRAQLLRQAGIAPGPMLLWPAGTAALLCAGSECRPLDPAVMAPGRSWWRWSHGP